MQRQVAAIITVLLLVVASISIAGCAVNIPGLSQSHLQAFVNAWHDNVNAKTGPYVTISSWQETPEGTDTIRVRYVTYNSSSNATITTDIRIKEFKQTGDATSFVNDMNEGYATTTSSFFGTNSTDNSVYTKTMGHNPAKTEAYMRFDSLIPPKGSVILQMDEFVIYGSVITLSGTSSSSTPSTSPASTPNSTAIPNHNIRLQNFLDSFHQMLATSSNESLDRWDVTWLTDSSVRLQMATSNEILIINPPKKAYFTDDWTITIFPSTEAATAYVNSIKNGYQGGITTCPLSSNGGYEDLIIQGHPPTLCASYTQSIPDTRYHAKSINQYDDVVIVKEEIQTALVPLS